MTKSLEEAILILRELPDDFQDRAAIQLIRYANELSNVDDFDAADV